MVLAGLLDDVATVSEDFIAKIAIETQTEWCYHEVELLEKVKIDYGIVFEVLHIKPQK